MFIARFSFDGNFLKSPCPVGAHPLPGLSAGLNGSFDPQPLYHSVEGQGAAPRGKGGGGEWESWGGRGRQRTLNWSGVLQKAKSYLHFCSETYPPP
jgi:hypothetical protein